MAGEEMPWTLKGVSDEIRIAARDAAEKTGKTVGEWLSDVIRTVEEEERLMNKTRNADAQATPAATPDDGSGLKEELSRLANRLDDVERKTDSALEKILERLEEMRNTDQGE